MLSRCAALTLISVFSTISDMALPMPSSWAGEMNISHNAGEGTVPESVNFPFFATVWVFISCETLSLLFSSTTQPSGIPGISPMILKPDAMTESPQDNRKANNIFLMISIKLFKFHKFSNLLHLNGLRFNVYGL